MTENDQYLELLEKSVILINGEVFREKFNKLMTVKPGTKGIRSGKLTSFIELNLLYIHDHCAISI